VPRVNLGENTRGMLGGAVLQIVTESVSLGEETESQPLWVSTLAKEGLKGVKKVKATDWFIYT